MRSDKKHPDLVSCLRKYARAKISRIAGTLALLPLLATLPVTATAAGGELPPAVTHRDGLEPETTANRIVDRVKLLRLYSVSDGEVRSNLFTSEDLKSGERFRVEGYVCGIVALCEGDMHILVEGEQMSRIKRNPDGTLSVKYFGRVNPEEIDNAYYTIEDTLDERIDEKARFLEGGYSFFPRVTGDSVNMSSTFTIVFGKEDETFSVPVEQTGYREIRDLQLHLGDTASSVTFHYIGSSLEVFKERRDDFEKRLCAMAEGIDFVESGLGTNLVGNVYILDFKGIHNAVVCDGENDIWFYAEAFLNEPIDELRTIAEHESLHIYIDKHRLAGSSKVREWFADLKGFDDFSVERFLLMTKGGLPYEKSVLPSENDLFFAFINERNFLKGMKGGHSERGVEEFCASFIHSLLFIDRLEQNLKYPVAVSGAPDASHLLTSREQISILDGYLETIDVLTQSLSKGGNAPTAGNGEMAFFDKARGTVCAVKECVSVEDKHAQRRLQERTSP